MIGFLRNFTKSWIFQGVLVLLIASFAIYGLRDVFSQQGTNAVVTAGTRSVSDGDFKRMFDNYKKNAESQGQQAPDPQTFVDSGDYLQMIEQIAQQTAVSAWLDKLGIRPSAKLIVDQISKTPAFFSNVTGRFDKDAYRGMLYQSGLTEKTYEGELSDEIAVAQYGDAALAGMKAPRISAALSGAFAAQTRDASFFMVSPETVAKPGEPTDADLQGFYKDHIKDLTIPELRTAEVVKFDPTEIANSIPADEDALKKMYTAEQSTLGTAETRSFDEITAPDMGKANAIAAALKAGQSPDAAAKANGGKVISYTGKAKSDVPDATVANTAFAMKTGDVSAPVQGELNIGVVRMGEIKAGSVPSFDAVRPKLLVEYQQGKAKDKINQMINDFQKAHEAGQDFDATAARMGLKPVPLQPMTAEGRTATQGVDYSRFTQVVKDIYDLQVNQSSDVDELGGGQYFAVKVTNIKPAGPPSLEELKPKLAQAWTMEKIASEVEAAANQAQSELESGKTFAQVAADTHAQIQVMTGIDTGNTKKQQLNDGMIGRVFESKVGETFQSPVDRGHIAIGRLDAIHQGDANAANIASAGARKAISMSMLRDVEDQTRKTARATTKTKTFPTVAVRALGVTPTDTSSASASKAKS